ncbi:PREDICTED: putative leucine-rich repeat-containing protein DDB_G0290503 [Cyphomyrmex costatus]|uniref:putative leucine-rich repeat-containing protein DDB_G0290503 n=1 Tax=Cyphomyrmex costatus TaxID=456900 RepID=UPI0008521F72|nr:PREDICTED: putative leucine-rich repeat-containing protein DDB_G0290503 [Cyphomyrmex costatus]
MELWEKVILEWINCLEVQDEPVKNIIELQDGIFYINFLKLIKWKKLQVFDQEDIMKFIEEEYPTFKVNKDDDTEHIYLASLLLLHLCRVLFATHQSLQYNMCDNLKNETQIRVKAFLESVLPIGKDITKETMREVIMEVVDTAMSMDNCKTPRTPSSKNFLNSPLTCSGRSKKILIERVRELKDLKCNLAMERFTNADLRDDLLRQCNKIDKLQKKLDEKSAKIKELQAELFKPNTPQSSCTQEDSSQENYYKRYINDLENQLNKQQDEINKLEIEKDAISKELCCTRRTSKHYKENFINCEQSLESLTKKIELKDKELIELRMCNEELRVYMKELNKNANPEQSFEVEDLLCPATKSLNTSEVLSTVIEIQLLEAKEESAILHAQIDSLKGRYDLLMKDYRAAIESNRDLQEKIKTLDRVQAELNNVQKELDVSNVAVTNLQKKLSETEQSNITLSTELENLKLDMKNLNELLESEKINSSHLSTTLTQTNSQITEHLAYIHKLTDEKDSYKSSIENCSKKLRDILHCDNQQFIEVKTDNLNNSTLNDLTKCIETMLHNCKVMCVSYESDIEKLKTTIDETNTNLCKQQLTITSLEEQNKQNLVELTNIEEEKKQKDLLIDEQKQIILTYSQEIEVLKEIKDEKDSYKSSIENCSKKLRDILHCDNQQFIEVKTDNLNNSTLNDLTKCIETMLHNCKVMCVSYESDIEKLKTTIDETNTNLCKQQLTITSLEEQNKQNLVELTNIEEEKKQKDLLVDEQKQIILTYSQEIEVLKEIKDEKDSYKSSIENCSKKLRDILHCDNQQFIEVKTDNLNNSTLNDLTKCIETMLHNCKVMCVSYESDIEKLKTTIDETNMNLCKQQLTITSLEEQNKQNLVELANIEEEKKQKDLLVDEQKQIILTYSQEIEVLKEIKDEKLVLEQNLCLLHELTNNLTNRESLLRHVMLKDLQNEELSKIQAINTTLQRNLLENEEKVDTLEKKERILINELNEYKRNVQELRDMNQTLEELYAVMKTETNNKIDSLESDNAKILLELKDATDKLNLLYQEKSDIMTQIGLKEAQINKLLLDILAFKSEKNDLMNSHKEILNMKDKELGMKEEALLMLQTKMEKVTNEANVMEKKMKEIIINLQEIRSSQDAVLATQEAALKEKCLYVEELQERFDNSKEILNKELEDTKLSLRECQIKFFDLENEFNNQNRTIAELQVTLKTVNVELEKSKEYCKHMDASQEEIIKLCQELEHPTKNLNSTITKTCSDFDLHDVIKITINELYKSQKIISHLSNANIELNETLSKQEVLIENGVKDKEEVCSLKNKIRELEIIAQKRNNYLKSLIKNKESLQESLQKVFDTRNDLDTILTSSKQKWNEILAKFQNIFYIEYAVCDEFKQLQIKKTSLENALLKCQIDYSENIKSVSDILWEKFLWTEQKLHDTYLCSIHEKECLDILTNVEEDQFSNEKIVINMELEKYKTLQTDVMKSEEEIKSFTALVTFYDNSLKSGEIKSQAEIEKKLQNQINQLTKERKDLKTKMDTMRSRNIKLEKNIDDLRMQIKELKPTESMPMETASTEVNLTTSEGSEVQFLKEELGRMKEQNQQLHEEKEESSKLAKQKFDSQLKDIHAKYEQKLEDMKQQMKTIYNEQITKLSKDQEKIMQEKLQNQMEMMCQRQRDELNKYKAHIGDLSSQLWNVGEKLLIEQQQKQDTLQRLKVLETKLREFQTDQPIATISRKTCKMEKQESLPNNVQQAHKITTLITEETLEKRHSIRSMQAMGSVFKTEDEDEIFDNVYLTDLKKGNFMSITDVNRLSVLQMRNSLCKPHLKSSYPTEMQFLPSTLTEEEIKTGSSVEENFNDSLSQSLLPEQKVRKKDRSQISYKKPGPPTPSKNGGRLSLQSNELRSPSSRILKERNVDRRTTTTPHSLKNIFSLKRQDENATSTPKRRLSSLFRKSRLQSDR